MSRPFIPAKLRFEVFSRDNFTCQYCGRSAPHVKLHVDHVVPVSKGGPTTKENLRTSCQSCNSGKGARTPDCGSLTAWELEDEFAARWGAEDFIYTDPYITSLYGEPCL